MGTCGLVARALGNARHGCLRGLGWPLIHVAIHLTGCEDIVLQEIVVKGDLVYVRELRMDAQGRREGQKDDDQHQTRQGMYFHLLPAIKLLKEIKREF